LEDRTGIDAGDLPAEAGRGHHKVYLLGHQRLRRTSSAIVTKQ
jgi:hypothetical protein